jgi:hypothetical protein
MDVLLELKLNQKWIYYLAYTNVAKQNSLLPPVVATHANDVKYLLVVQGKISQGTVHEKQTHRGEQQ